MAFSYHENCTRDRISHDVSWLRCRFPRLFVVHVCGQLYGVPRAWSYQYVVELSINRVCALGYQLTPRVSASAPFSAVLPPPGMRVRLPSKKLTGSSDRKARSAYRRPSSQAPGPHCPVMGAKGYVGTTGAESRFSSPVRRYVPDTYQPVAVTLSRSLPRGPRPRR